jgi:signal peptidase II
MAKKNAGLMLMLWLGIALVVVLLDQVTKITMSERLLYGQSEPITTYFNLVMVYNKGAAFSFLSDQPGWQRYFFTGVSVIASVFILWMLKRNPDQRLFCWALALILGGAIGNLIDRVAYGHVIDFLDFHVHGWHWPAFNVADSAITVGAILFVLDEFRRVNR